METHYELTDKAFIEALKDCSLDPELFGHEAHLRLAWIYIRQDGVNKAIKDIGKQIKAYVQFLGIEDKYNETVTVAAVKVVHHFYLKIETKDFKTFIEEFPQLKYNFKALLSQHYKMDIFDSEMAKKTFLEPDLLPFD